MHSLGSSLFKLSPYLEIDIVNQFRNDSSQGLKCTEASRAPDNPPWTVTRPTGTHLRSRSAQHMRSVIKAVTLESRRRLTDEVQGHRTGSTKGAQQVPGCSGLCTGARMLLKLDVGDHCLAFPV